MLSSTLPTIGIDTNGRAAVALTITAYIGIEAVFLLIWPFLNPRPRLRLFGASTLARSTQCLQRLVRWPTPLWRSSFAMFSLLLASWPMSSTRYNSMPAPRPTAYAVRRPNAGGQYPHKIRLFVVRLPSNKTLFPAASIIRANYTTHHMLVAISIQPISSSMGSATIGASTTITALSL